jgi:HNH endonuclease/AP2 domain
MIFTIKGKQLQVDNCDTDLLGLTVGGWSSWSFTEGYLKTNVGGRNTYLHRLVAEAAGMDISQAIDHINGNKLDNRRENLRPATCTQNNRNVCKRKDNTSGYKGVSWNNRRQKWEAYISVDGRSSHLGYYSTALEAALAYNVAAVQHHHEFAYLNPLTQENPSHVTKVG